MVRVKPYEGDIREKILYFVSGNKITIQNPQSNENKSFKFNFVSDESSSQFEIYNQSAKHLLNYFVCGTNCTLFTYGITGAGKTFTLFGSSYHEGLFDLTMNELFQVVSGLGYKSYSVQDDTDSPKYFLNISLIEIYNEKLFDLLNNKNELAIREINNVITIDDLKCSPIKNTLEAKTLLKNGKYYS